ncbi:hypothetical protein ACWEL8_27680 [Streptomyces sp. NPDC004690]
MLVADGSKAKPLKALTALCAVLAFGVGCGGGQGDFSFDASSVKATLPDSAVVPGWDETLAPVAYPLEKAKELAVARCDGDGSCENVRYVGMSGVRKHDKPWVSFYVMTYDDPTAADAAYGTVWKAWQAQVPGRPALSLGEIGDRNDAVMGESVSMVKGAKSVLIQARVGSAIMLTTGESGADVRMDPALLKKLATVFAERAGQVQDGEPPSSAPAS